MKKILVLSLITLSTILTNCAPSSSNGGGSGGTNNLSCASLPAGVTIDPASVCTSISGKWTTYTVDQDSKFAFQSCNAEESSLYANQDVFNANEGTSTTVGVNITSNNDYVKTSTCASGSTVYTASGSTTHYLYIWEKQP